MNAFKIEIFGLDHQAKTRAFYPQNEGEAKAYIDGYQAATGYFVSKSVWQNVMTEDGEVQKHSVYRVVRNRVKDVGYMLVTPRL